MWMTPPADALAWLDQCIEEAQESLAHLSDALVYLYACALPDELPGGRLPPETARLLLAEQRRCQLASALIRRLDGHVRAEMARLREPHAVSLAPAEPVQV
jgi:hypothetical protein